MKGSRPHLIHLDEALSSGVDDVVQGSCWSIWEGCVCRHLKDHFGLHGCADRECNTTWTTEQADAWMAAEREALQNGETVADRHRGSADDG